MKYYTSKSKEKKKNGHVARLEIVPVWVVGFGQPKIGPHDAATLRPSAITPTRNAHLRDAPPVLLSALRNARCLLGGCRVPLYVFAMIGGGRAGVHELERRVV